MRCSLGASIKCESHQMDRIRRTLGRAFDPDRLDRTRSPLMRGAEGAAGAAGQRDARWEVPRRLFLEAMHIQSRDGADPSVVRGGFAAFGRLTLRVVPRCGRPPCSRPRERVRSRTTSRVGLVRWVVKCLMWEATRAFREGEKGNKCPFLDGSPVERV